MLMRTDPFRDLDRWAQQLLGTALGPSVMPMDAYRDGDRYVIELDLPGVDPESIDLQVDHAALTVRAERPAPAADGRDYAAAERPSGSFTRQVFLGDTLDGGKIAATYDAGVLTISIPIAEQAKPRKIAVTAASERKIINA